MSDKNLRPSSLSDYIGQEELKEQLYVSMEASKKRKRQLPHVLFYGGAGLGKTTISQITEPKNSINGSGLTIPRMVSLKNELTFVRTGPGKEFPIKFEINQKGYPCPGSLPTTPRRVCKGLHFNTQEA